MSEQRVALGIRYDGHDYHGWQTQDGVMTVQRQVERALSFVADHTVNTICAGRTDAGVHASGQVVHFETQAERSEYSWVFGANSNLPPDIAILWAKHVDMGFHARFSARARRYRYVIYNHEIRPALLRHHVGWYYRPLDEAKMAAAANHFIGEHDFSSFRGADCQAKNPVRTIYNIDVKRIRRMIIIEINANAFLLHMVRNIVGTLVAVGCGDKGEQWAQNVLAACDRRQAGVTISPNGLYLVEVTYPPKFHLPRTPIGPFFLP